MNQNLQSIPDHVQQTEGLNKEEKTNVSNIVTALNLELAKKNRELEIEAALEKVRARTMAMRRSEEIADILGKMFEELKRLDMVLVRVLIWIFNPEEKYISWWSANTEVETTANSYRVDYNDHPVFLTILDAWKKKLPLELYTLSGEEKDSWQDHLFNNTGLSKLPEMVQKGMRSEGTIFTTSAISDYGLLMSGSLEPLSAENIDILQRFGRVFQQSYTRYIDVQNAEAQARESQIQLAMERVRARTMAMQHSGELGEAASLLFKQIADLGTKSWSSGFDIWEADEVSATAWMSNPDGSVGMPFIVPYTEDPFFKQILEAKRSGIDFFVMESAGKELEETYQYLFNLPDAKKHFDGVTRLGFQMPAFQITHSAFFSHGFLMFITYEPVPEMWDIFKRFSKVFEQTYTRFLDLQKAEAQARESQIQLAMERVRARTMAMQHSDELADAASLLFKQVSDFGVKVWSSAFQIWNADNISTTAWASAPDGSIQAPFRLPYNEDIFFKQIYDARLRGEDFFVMESGGKELEETYHYMFNLPGVKKYFDDALDSGFPIPKFQITHCAFFSQGYVMFITYEPCPEMWDIFKRFSKVFEQTYTRFLDLQKAEAQARESQIQLAMERVRARTMAMQRSEELADAAHLLFQQVMQLGVHPWTSGFQLWDEDRKAVTVWTSTEGVLLPPFKIPATEDPLMIHIVEAAQKGEPLYVEAMSGVALEDHYKYMFSLPTLPEVFQKVSSAGHEVPTFQINHAAFFSNGYLLFITHEPCPEAHDIFIRFAKVFEQTYTRFLDLQRAEAQARESQIQLALERVRARTMAMQRSEELTEAASLLFKQVQSFGVTAFSCGFNIWQADDISVTSWMANPDGSLGWTPLRLPHLEYAHFKQSYEARKRGEDFFVLEAGGKELEDTYRYMFSIPEWKDRFGDFEDSGFPVPKFQISHYAFFSQGYLLFITYEPVPEMWDLFKRFAKVFEQTYTRFLDLQKAEAQAKEAQVQLAMERVRARTMAMQKSDELAQAANLLFQQMQSLDIPAWSAGYCIWDDEEKKSATFWMSSEGVLQPPFRVPLTENSMFIHYREGFMQGESFYAEEFGGEELVKHYEYMYTIPDIRKMVDKFDKEGIVPTFPLFQVNHVVYFAQGFLLFVTHQQVPEVHDVFKRFGKVFEQTYTRFLDLQKAEAQARESQIQLAMERVRARTMAMQKSEELAEVATVLFQQVNALGVPQVACGLNLWEIGEKVFTFYPGSAEGDIFPPCINIPLTEDPVFIFFDESRKRGGELAMYESKDAIQKAHYEYMNKLPGGIGSFMQNLLDAGVRFPTRQIDHIANFSHGQLLFITYEHFPEMHDIFKRFAKVFEQTYTRFLDLQKAEAQAREAQIEAALERVRSRTMAMQRSVELGDAALLLFQQVKTLGTTSWACGYNIWDDDKKATTAWMAREDAIQLPFKVPTNEDVFIRFYEAAQRAESLYVEEIGGEICETHYKYLSTLPVVSEIMKGWTAAGIAPPTYQIFHIAYFSQGYLMFITYEPVPELWDVFKRFAKVFEQTYTRFLDLQKAEWQARESRIEASLERVRARAMAMHKTDELQEAAELLYRELTGLGISSMVVTYSLMDSEEKNADYYSINPVDGKIGPKPFVFPHTETDIMRDILASWKKQEAMHLIELDEEATTRHQTYIGEHVQSFITRNEMNMPFSVEAFLAVSPKKAVIYTFNFTQGYIFIIGGARLTNEQEQMVLRFTKVFELTYRRFLDLNQAEAQAKEAQIEAALERVRGKAMAMHSSRDLSETIEIFYKELHFFSITPMRCGVGLLNKENRVGELYTWNTTEQGESLELIGRLRMEGHSVLEKVYESWMSQTEYHPILRGQEINEYHQILRPQIAFPNYHSGDVQYGYFFFFNEGGVYAWTEKEMKEDELQIYRRFTSVLSLTYKRYKDLQQSEAGAKVAIKQAALDRIRAEIASMRSVGDLDRITPLIWNELTVLGISFSRCGVFIMDEEHQLVHTFLSTPDGKAIAAFRQPYNATGETSQIIAHWHKKEMYKLHWDEAQFIANTKNLLDQGAITSGEKYLTEVRPTNLYLHFLPFLQGMLYVGNTAPLSDDELHLVQNLAEAFSTAYARYEDFNRLESAKKQVENTLVDLKQAQSQLVQSEKMASLGELTAGIAHEIQNPLNFVTNFSEVNKELLTEMKAEMDKGNIKEAKALANDLIQNEDKINHHGRRADAIVKGMLQHSQTTTGQKEPTDINNLADEYFRLSYHGLRAKNKSFHAGMHTEFDKTIGKINIVPQDIGRVLLNLYNNAFYAVTPAPLKGANGNDQSNGNGAVWLSTRKLEDKILISIRDNGPGIPQKVLDKIFQPFFTTKPTGQGTGLGLSLAYDIIKAHGGEIKVETREGEGAEFIIQLPVG